jgi:hypothetical protein
MTKKEERPFAEAQGFGSGLRSRQLFSIGNFRINFDMTKISKFMILF